MIIKICMCIYIYIYIERERKIEREREKYLEIHNTIGMLWNTAGSKTMDVPEHIHRGSRRWAGHCILHTVARLWVTDCCGKAELCLFVGFLCFSTLCQNFSGISPEFHRKFTGLSQEFADVCQNVTGIHRISPEYRIGAP